MTTGWGIKLRFLFHFFFQRPRIRLWYIYFFTEINHKKMMYTTQPNDEIRARHFRFGKELKKMEISSAWIIIIKNHHFLFFLSTTDFWFPLSNILLLSANLTKFSLLGAGIYKCRAERRSLIHRHGGPLPRHWWVLYSHGGKDQIGLGNSTKSGSHFEQIKR